MPCLLAALARDETRHSATSFPLVALARDETRRSATPCPLAASARDVAFRRVASCAVATAARREQVQHRRSSGVQEAREVSRRQREQADAAVAASRLVHLASEVSERWVSAAASSEIQRRACAERWSFSVASRPAAEPSGVLQPSVVSCAPVPTSAATAMRARLVREVATRVVVASSLPAFVPVRHLLRPSNCRARDPDRSHLAATQTACQLARSHST